MNIEKLTQSEFFRNMLCYVFFSFYILILLLSILGFAKQAPRLIMALSIFSLLSLVTICGYAGLTTGDFFFVADFCESVHGAIYENQFPIYGTSLGLVASCYESQTKSSLYSQQYLFHDLRNRLKEQMSKVDPTSKEYKDLANLSADIKDVQDNDIKYFTQCTHVYDNVVFAESTLCKEGMDNLKQIIQCLCVFLLFVLMTSIAITRLKALVEKKSMEFEV